MEIIINIVNIYCERTSFIELASKNFRSNDGKFRHILKPPRETLAVIHFSGCH